MRSCEQFQICSVFFIHLVYVEPAETTFSMKSPSVNAVNKKITAINERKTAGLDKIPCKLLKIAAEIVALSLPQIFDTIH